MKSGDIWLVDLSDAKGHEQRGVRPAIVVGSANGLVLVVPLTSSLGSARFSHTHMISPDPHNGLDAKEHCAGLPDRCPRPGAVPEQDRGHR